MDEDRPSVEVRHEMLTERLAKGLSKQIDRRSVLAKLGAGTVAAALSLIGAPRLAEALTPWHCCNLCKPNSGRCGGCKCVWCWYCCEGSEEYACCECHNDSRDCGGDCNYVGCSYAYDAGTCFR